MKGLKFARKRANLSPARIAEEIGVDRPLYSKMEHERCRPTPEQFKAICDLTDSQPEDIYTRKDVDYGIRGKGHHKTGSVSFSADIPADLIVDRAAFRDMLYNMGYSGITGWLTVCIKRAYAENAARKGRRAS